MRVRERETETQTEIFKRGRTARQTQGEKEIGKNIEKRAKHLGFMAETYFPHKGSLISNLSFIGLSRVPGIPNI